MGQERRLVPRALGLSRWVGAIALGEGAVRVSAGIFRLRGFRSHRRRGGKCLNGSNAPVDPTAPIENSNPHQTKGRDSHGQSRLTIPQSS